ncbi:MAG: type II toxin-antitoxin system HicB family antitoxin [Pseudomonadota bacterium]
MHAYFPAILEADETDGGYVVEVVGTGVNGQGETRVDAMREASEILQSIIWDAVADGEPIPTPGSPSDEEARRGALAMIQATVPAAAA